MEVLALLYTFLLVTICLLLAVVLYRTGRPQQGQQGTEALRSWLAQQLAAQAKENARQQAALAQQNEAALRSVSDALQTAVQNMSATLAQGQTGQQEALERRLNSLQQQNVQQMEQLRNSLNEGMKALQEENARKLDEDPPYCGRAAAGRAAKTCDRELPGGKRTAGAGV